MTSIGCAERTETHHVGNMSGEVLRGKYRREKSVGGREEKEKQTIIHQQCRAVSKNSSSHCLLLLMSVA